MANAAWEKFRTAWSLTGMGHREDCERQTKNLLLAEAFVVLAPLPRVSWAWIGEDKGKFLVVILVVIREIKKFVLVVLT